MMSTRVSPRRPVRPQRYHGERDNYISDGLFARSIIQAALKLAPDNTGAALQLLSGAADRIDNPESISVVYAAGAAIARKSKDFQSKAYDYAQASIQWNAENARAWSEAILAAPEAKLTSLIQTAQKKFPLDAKLYGAIGHKYQQLGNYHAALAAAEKIIALAPNNLVGYGQLSTVLLALDRKDEALAAAEKHIALAPNDPVGYGQLSTVLLALDRKDEALAAAEKHIALAPNDPVGYGQLSTVLLALDHKDEALAAAEKAIALAPNNPVGYGQLSTILLALDRKDEALAAAEKVKALAPNNPVGYGQLSTILLALDRQEDALADAEKHIALAPNNPIGYGQQSTALLALDGKDEALAAAEKAIALAPNNPVGYGHQSTALLALDRKDEALAAAEKHIALAPNDPVGYYLKIKTLSKMHNPASLDAAIHQAYEIFPNNERILHRAAWQAAKNNRIDKAKAYFNDSLKQSLNINTLKSIKKLTEFGKLPVDYYEGLYAVAAQTLPVVTRKELALGEVRNDKNDAAFAKAYQQVFDDELEIPLGHYSRSKIFTGEQIPVPINQQAYDQMYHAYADPTGLPEKTYSARLHLGGNGQGRA